MNNCPATAYDAAYLPMREPNHITWQFDPHIYKCLRTAGNLQQSEIVRDIVVVGGQAKWYGEDITPPLSSESEFGKQHLLLLGAPPDRIKTESLSQTSIGNHVLTAENVFIPEGIQSILMITARERAPRLYRLGAHILYGVIPTFHFTTRGGAPELTQKEAFALRMQEEYLLRHLPRVLRVGMS